MAPREADERYLDILAAIGRIRAHVEATRGIGDDEPAAADLLRDAVHYQLIVVGEAIGSLPESELRRDPEIPWRAIIGLRNRLAHEYYRIDPAMIRQVVDTGLADLERRIGELLDRGA